MPAPRLLKPLAARSISRRLTSSSRYLGITSRRWYQPFSPITAPPPCEHFNVPCRSNGFVKIDVFHASTPSSPIVIYLPPGPMVPESIEEEEAVISILSKTSTATVVRINYRASPAHQYPIPIHDVLSGYDWICDNLLQDGFKRPYIARLGVCGELMGGSLAAMLGLTECRLGESRIAAAALGNPIADWVFPDDLPAIEPSELPEPLAPDETAFPADEDPMAIELMPKPVTKPRKPAKSASKKKPLTSWQRYGDNTTLPALTLSAERDVLFRRSEDYFDRFASPIHFFRSPYAQMVSQQQDDMLASKQPIEPLDFETQLSLNHYAAVNNQPVEPPEPPILSRCRAYTRNFPPAGAKIRFPNWNVMAGEESPLYDQAKELTRHLRRSAARHALKSNAGRTRWIDKLEKQMYEESAEKKVHFDSSSPKIGLWTQIEEGEDGKQHVHNVGLWMKSILS